MKSSFELKGEAPCVFDKLNRFFNGKKSGFPCLFAISAFNKGAMRVSVINDGGNSLAEKISNDLVNLSKYITNDLNEPELSLITYLAVLTNENYSEVSLNGTLFLTDLIQELYRIDPGKWPDNKTKNTNDPEFEFYHNDRIWFPVLLSPSHQSTIRRSPFLMVAFQPGRTFDYNKTAKKDHYERMRRSIHRRIDSFYQGKRPHYLSEKSSGKNICQYVGYDETEKKEDFYYKELV